ncbi:hypothetical protein [Chlamydia vaughanii]|uniref:hypothetical protein n=1 Tax=Chlamydia vaughanii TaxID=3112552 RepID=UPI0032B221EE
MSIFFPKINLPSNTGNEAVPLEKSRLVSVSTLIGCVTLTTIALATVVISCLFLVPSLQLLTTLIALLTTVLGILFTIQMTSYLYEKYLCQKLEPSKLLPLIAQPKLHSGILKKLSQESITSLTHTQENEFFPDFQKWEAVFLKDPELLLKNALASWEIIKKSNLEATLSAPYIGFYLSLTHNHLQKIEESAVMQKETQRGVIHQISHVDVQTHAIQHDSNVIHARINGADYILPVIEDLQNEIINAENSSNQEARKSLYKIFKTLFTKYYVALSHSIPHETVICIQPLTLGSSDYTICQMEWLALFCAIQQLRFVTVINPESPPQTSTDPQNSPAYVLTPEDYWKIFVNKDFVSFPRESAYFGLISHPHPQTEQEKVLSSLNINRARFMETQHVILSGLSHNTIRELLQPCSKQSKN